MVEIKGLVGLRPSKSKIAQFTCPPYDVIKPDTDLHRSLFANHDSLVHVTLGNEPVDALSGLIQSGVLIQDSIPCFYIYEQTYTNNGMKKQRTGLLAAAKVYPYATGDIRRHEKTFDDKVQGRLALRKKTNLTLEPVFLLTNSKISAAMEAIKRKQATDNTLEYQFLSKFQGETDLDGIENRVFRIPENSPDGAILKQLIAKNPLYIADGHHRYHTSLLNVQSHFLAYITQEAEIQAYNRVLNPQISFETAKLPLIPTGAFETPKKHRFCLYSGGKAFIIGATHIPKDVIGRLDCSILEREVYPAFGLTHEMIRNPGIFDYYPESQLNTMKKQVDSGMFKMAIALHPVSIDELMAVADAGLNDPDIVMPEKSTFFSPKILSGIFIYRH